MIGSRPDRNAAIFRGRAFFTPRVDLPKGFVPRTMDKAQIRGTPELM